MVTSLNGTILDFNRHAQTLFGYSEDEIRGSKFSLLMEPGFQPKLSALGTFNPDPAEWTPVCGQAGTKARRKNGELFPAEIQKNQSEQGGEIVHIYYVRDVSLTSRYEQRIAELEREIAHLSRHSVLGELATSITHELSQPLTAITNYTAAAQPIQSRGATAEELATSFDLIAKAGDQARRAWLIMHKLRQLLQHRGAEHAEGDLRLAVEDAVQLATLGAAQDGITVTVDVAARARDRSDGSRAGPGAAGKPYPQRRGRAIHGRRGTPDLGQAVSECGRPGRIGGRRHRPRYRARSF